MSKKIIWEEDIKIKSYHIDKKGRLSIPSILSFIQEIAGNHAIHLGYGYSEMKKLNMVWMLSRLKLKVFEMPLWLEEIKVKTWIAGVKKFFTRRDFEFFKNDKRSILIVTEWILFDFKNQRLIPVNKLESRENLIVDKYVIQDEPEKLKKIEKPDKVDEYSVKYSDIDILGHMNNKEYARIVLDTYPLNWLENNDIDIIEINFKNQALIHEKLLIYTVEEEKSFFHQILKPDGKISALLKIIWK